MNLRIIFKSDSGDTNGATSFNLVVENVSNWSTGAQVLTVVCDGGKIRQYPLCNILSFYEEGA